jgi:hypothetical protein
MRRVHKPCGKNWSNDGFPANVVNDIPIPNESRLVPSHWAKEEIE